MLKLDNSQLTSTPYTSRLGLECLAGCDIKQITPAQIAEFKQALWNHGVVVIKNQKLTATELEEFARKTFNGILFGPSSFTPDPELDPDIQSQYAVKLGNPKGFDQIPAEQRYKATLWHQDKDSLPSRPELDMNSLYVVMVYSVKVPQEDKNGQLHTTEFLDLIEAYNNIEPSQQRELEQISMYQTVPFYQQDTPWDEIPKKLYPIVSTHKVTGKKGLYLGSCNTAFPVGMENQPEKAQAFWQDLFQFVLERTPIYSHVWEAGDLIFWDNSQVMHRATFYDATKYQRIALRLGIVDTGF